MTPKQKIAVLFKSPLTNKTPKDAPLSAVSRVLE